VVVIGFLFRAAVEIVIVVVVLAKVGTLVSLVGDAILVLVV
jgi:hypothetical protein